MYWHSHVMGLLQTVNFRSCIVKDMTYKVPNPYASTPQDLYFISDPPHLLKTIRNSWFNSKRKLWVHHIEHDCYSVVIL